MRVVTHTIEHIRCSYHTLRSAIINAYCTAVDSITSAYSRTVATLVRWRDNVYAFCAAVRDWAASVQR